MDVPDGDHLVEPERRVREAHAAALHRKERIAGDQVQAVVDVRQTRSGGEPAQVALGLLDADDVGLRPADGTCDLVEVDLHAAVPDVGGHHGERPLGLSGRCRRRGLRSRAAGQGRESCQCQCGQQGGQRSRPPARPDASLCD